MWYIKILNSKKYTFTPIGYCQLSPENIILLKISNLALLTCFSNKKKTLT